jgi:dihydrofolate reductase
MDWFVRDPAVDKALNSGDERMDTIVLGGITYRGFERSWVPLLSDPNAPKEMKAVAERLTNMKKIVFSAAMKEVAWANSELFADNPVDVVRNIKEDQGDGILMWGSGTIVQQLANAGLIDEYVFIVTPVVAGEGRPLFQHVQQFGLSLVEAKSFPSGNVVLRYRLAKPGEAAG